MKINSINFIKESDVKTTTRTTELATVVEAIAEQLKKAPAGQALEVKIVDFKKWTRSALQSRLQRRGIAAIVSTDTKGTFWVKRGEAKAAGKK